MNKKKTYIIVIICGIIAMILSSIIFIKQYEKNIYEQAQKEFEKDVLRRYINDMREIGFEDLELSVDYVEYPWDKWTKQVKIIEYHTEEIDSLYTEDYHSENAKEILRILKNMRNLRNRYCEYYVYEIRGKEVTIVFGDNYTESFTVHSEDYMYNLFAYDGKYNLNINGNPVYHSGYTSNSSDINKTPARNEKHSISNSTNMSNSSNKLYDSYNVYDYTDPEDFYYDWEDDFDGYEDAEEYWEDAWDEVE